MFGDAFDAGAAKTVLRDDMQSSIEDPVSRRSFWTLIYGLARDGVTIFLTTHYIDEAEHADRVALMLNGRMIALAPPRELRDTGLSGTLLEVDAEPPVDALGILPSVGGVREVTLYGTLLHVLVHD